MPCLLATFSGQKLRAEAELSRERSLSKGGDKAVFARRKNLDDRAFPGPRWNGWIPSAVGSTTIHFRATVD